MPEAQQAVHRESQETKDFIADWIAPGFFFSKKDVWHRFGMLGVFGDYVLAHLQGDILEIGVGESSIYLSALAKKYERRIYHCDISASKILNPMTVDGYLSRAGQSLYLTEHDVMNDINIVNPEDGGQWAGGVIFAGSSDMLFKAVKITPLALAFIDGDHNYEQVKKDFINIEQRLVDDGFIILHDTYPPSEEYLNENRCGTVYRLRQELEGNARFDCMTLVKGCAIDVGLTIVRKKPSGRKYFNG